MTLDKEYKILVVDDAKDTQILLDFDLSELGYCVICCDGGKDAIELLNTHPIDLILLDMYMPGLSGLATLKQVKANDLTKNIPIIMLSASTDEDEVVAALEFGADDYVIKPYVAKVLLARIKTAIRLQEKTAQLEYLAKTDFLTGINNRGSFFELSRHAISLANRTEQPLVVAMFDIDFFKTVNDNYGHDSGDQVLRVFSQGLTEVFRGYDIIGRVGGEEFAVCLPNTTRENAYTACERFRHYVEQLTVHVINDNTEISINITVSIGLVVADNELVTIGELLKKADRALYYVKRHGRNQVIDVDCIQYNEHDVIATNDVDDIAQKVKVDYLQENTKVNSFEGINFNIGMDNVLGDEGLFKEILVMFYQDHHLDGKKLEKAVKDKDMDTLKHIVHTLKGVASSVGALDLFKVAKVLDIAVNEDNQAQVELLLLELLPVLDSVMEGIASNLDISE